MQAHLIRAAEVKKAIEWIMCNIDDHYAADSVAAAIAVGAAAAETAQDTPVQGGSLSYSPLRNTAKISSFQGKANDAASPTNMSRNFRLKSCSILVVSQFHLHVDFICYLFFICI